MPDHYPDTKESLGKTTTVKGAKIKGASKLMGGSPVLGPASTSLFSGGGRSPVGANAPIILGNQKSIAINSRKISILKNISESHGKRISGDTVGQKISGGGLLESLNNINDNVNGIVDVLVEEQEFKSDSAEDERKRLEALTRGKKEKDLEKDKFAGLKKVGEKVLAPVKSLWEKLWGFLQTLILGRFAIKLWDWLSDKKNQKKVAAIGRFLKDWWPVLLSSYVIFGTGFIKMAAGLVRSVGWAATKMVTVIIPALVKAIAKIKSAKLIKGLGGLLGGLGGKGKALTGLMGAGAFAEGGVVPGSGSGDTVPAMLTPGEFVMTKGAVQKYGVDTLEGMNAAAGGTNKPEMGLPGLGGGGGGTDSLTEQAKVKTWGSAIGDFLSGDDGRSRYMTDLEKSQRMAGGGLVQYFKNGGKVDDGIGTIDWNNRVNRDLAKYPDKRLRSSATLLEGAVVDVYDEMGKWRATISGPPLAGTRLEVHRAKKDMLLKTKSSSSDVKKKVDATKVVNTRQMGRSAAKKRQEKEKEIQKPKEKGRGFWGALGGITDAITLGLTDFDQRGRGDFLQFDPISGGKDKKWGVEPPEPPRDFQQELENVLGGPIDFGSMGAPGLPPVNQELPMINPSAMISISKIRALGISV